MDEVGLFGFNCEWEFLTLRTEAANSISAVPPKIKCICFFQRWWGRGLFAVRWSVVSAWIKWPSTTALLYRLRLILPTPLIFCWTVAHAKNHVASTGTHHCFALAFYYVIIGLLGIALCHCNISKLNAIELNFNLLVAVVAHVCNNGLESVSL